MTVVGQCAWDNRVSMDVEYSKTQSKIVCSALWPERGSGEGGTMVSIETFVRACPSLVPNWSIKGKTGILVWGRC